MLEVIFIKKVLIQGQALMKLKMLILIYNFLILEYY